MHENQVGYFCHYVPWELFEACGLRGTLVTPAPPFPREREAFFPVPFCPFSKLIAEEIHRAPFSLYVLGFACDASRRTKEILEYLHTKKNLPKTILSLPIPFLGSSWGIQRLAENLRQLSLQLALLAGIHPWEVETRLGEVILSSYEERKEISTLFFAGRLPTQALLTHKRGESLPSQEARPSVLLIGSHLFLSEVVQIAEECGLSVIEESPRGTGPWLILPEQDFVPSSDPFLDLARLYTLHKFPCPRVNQRRAQTIHKMVDHLSLTGVIFLYPQFCDAFLYQLGLLRRFLAVPLLPLAHDTEPNLAQWTTRIEAFREVVRCAPSSPMAPQKL